GGLEQLWSVRKLASPALARLPPSRRSLQVVEDGCVPLEHLGKYIAGVRAAAERWCVPVALFGHAGDGHVHVNALPDTTVPGWEEALAGLFAAVTELLVKLEGTPSGEHGDGRLRAGLLERFYGADVVALFRDVKRAYDPRAILNPGVILPSPEPLRVQWRGDSSPGERLAEFAGRICYMSQHNPAHRSTAEYLENIKKQGHGSVLEHAVYVLLIEGISRSCSHELVRHRAGFGYSQLSQRYVDESHAAFVMPPAMVGDPALESQWQTQMTDAQAAYVHAVEDLMKKYEWVTDKVHRRKMAREAARSVLPNATEVKIVVSGN